MLNCRELAIGRIEPLRPRCDGAGVEPLAMPFVESARGLEPLPVFEPGDALLVVFLPELEICRKAEKHRKALAVKLGIERSIEQPIGEIVAPDHGDRYDARDLLAGPGEPENRALEHALASGAL